MNYAMYNPTYSQNSHEIVGPDGEIEKQWRINLSDSITSAPVAVNGTLYLSDQAAHLYTVDCKKGQIRNSYRMEGDVIGIPAKDGDDIYVGAGEYVGAGRREPLTIYRFTANKSDPVAEFQVPAYGEISVTDGTIYSAVNYENDPLGKFDGQTDLIGAFDSRTGDKLWTTTVSTYGAHNRLPNATSKPIVAGDSLYVPCSNGPSFFIIDRKDGSIIDCFADGRSFPKNTPSTVAVAGGVVYYTTGHKAYAVDAEKCEKIWSRSFQNNNYAGATTVRDGIIYFGTWTTGIRALDAETGEKLWTLKTDQSVRSTPAVVDGTVYIGANDCTLYALDAETGEKVWSYETESEIESSPLVADGMIYVGTYFGNLYAFG